MLRGEEGEGEGEGEGEVSGRSHLPHPSCQLFCSKSRRKVRTLNPMVLR